MNYTFINEDGLRRAMINLRKNYKLDLKSVLKDITSRDYSPMGSNILDIMGARNDKMDKQ